MLLPFRLISSSLKKLSRDITNDTMVKQNIFDAMWFLSNSEFQGRKSKNKVNLIILWKILKLY